MLSAISKKIIYNRLLDKGIKIDIAKLDHYYIDQDNFTDLNTMYDFIVNNWNKLIII